MEKITTYGLITYYWNNAAEPVFHISQRRDTLAYIHFIRGKVHEDQLKIYFMRMTRAEKDRIVSHPFDELWFDLFSDVHSRRTDNFLRARDKFMKFYTNGSLSKVYNETIDINIDLEWGFPKGRKKTPREPDLICAHREYREETRSKSYIDFINHPPIEYNYINRNEKTFYFIAKSRFKTFSKKYILSFGDITRESISDETGDLRWVTLRESKRFLQPELFNILCDVYSKIQDRSRQLLCLHDACKRSETKAF